MKYDQASFQARPPNTLCTCITWLSATEIAVGCANGFLAIWDIASFGEEGKSKPSPRSIPAPLLYVYLHQSYILAISCGYPSLPNFLATSSVDGHIRLTDLRAPTTDFVLSNRSRVAPPAIAFSDPLSSFISTEEYDSIRVFPIRVFHIPITIARADTFATCISVGHFHPCVLFGSTDGAVISTNPLRRILYRRIKSNQQTLFRHEWVRQGGGTSRLTEGYKIVTLDFSQQKTVGLGPNIEMGQEEGRKQKGEVKEKEGMAISTVREEEEGVSQIDWNPNLLCGGWVAVGWGSGLVRVQDLAL